MYIHTGSRSSGDRQRRRLGGRRPTLHLGALAIALSLPSLAAAETPAKTWAERLGYPPGQRVIMLHADDIGMCYEANSAAKALLSPHSGADGYIQSAAVMVPCPWFNEFAQWSVKNSALDVGLHLTLTSEWKHYRWGPVTPRHEVPGLLDKDGYLWRDVLSVALNASAAEVEKEIRAQVERSLAKGLRPGHLDTHMGTLFARPEFVRAYLKVAVEYRIPAMVIALTPKMIDRFRKQGYPMTPDIIRLIRDYPLPKLDALYSVPSAKTYEEKLQKFFDLVRSLEPGITEIIFHPSHLTEGLKKITNSWQQRAWEAQMFADPVVRDFLRKEGVLFTNWKEMMRRLEARVASKPAALRVDGVPSVPASLAAELKRYQELRTASFVDWHPNGDGMLVAYREENLYQLHHVSSPGARLKQLTRGPDPVSFGRYIDGESIVFTRGRHGNENYQILRLNTKTGDELLLTDGKSRNRLSRIHPDKQRAAITSTRRNGRDSDIYLIPLDSPIPVGATPQPLLKVDRETWFVSDWSPDGKRAIVARFISRNESYARILDVQSGAALPLPSEVARLGEEQAAHKVARNDYRFGASGENVFFLTDARGEFRELARVPLKTGAVNWLSEGPASTAERKAQWDVDDFELSPDRRSAVLSTNVDGYSHLYVIDDVEGARPTLRRLPLPEGIVRGMRFSPDGRRLGFTLGRPTSPQEAYSLEVATGKLTRWTFSERAGFNEKDFVHPRLIRYKSFDGREIPAYVFLPPAGGDAAKSRAKAGERIPVVVSIHGGPESQYRPWFRSSVQYYVTGLGVAVIAPNVRGSTGYGKSYSLLDNGMSREDSVKDIGALLDWVAGPEGRALGLDPDRLAVSGGSYGGYMVLASLIHYGDRIRAGIDSVGISDFITFLENTSAYRRHLRRVEYGDERDPQMRTFFERISPLRNMHRLRSALLLVHGENDPRVPFSETLQVVDKARKTGSPVWTIYAGNEGHGVARRENRDYVQAASVLFLKQFLDGASKESARAPAASIDLQIARGRAHDVEGRYAAAVREYDKVLRLDPARSHVFHLRANALFRLRRFSEAIRDYDESTKRGAPHDKNSCWERGLAYYYVGRYDDGRKQFEGYHTADNLDTENGIWRYLCIAETRGLAKAVETFYPYPRTVRPPYPSLHDLYTGKGDVKAVLAEAKARARDPESENRNLFYGHYYIGKYMEVRRKYAEAAKHIAKALEHRIGHFMYSCAEIDLERVKRKLRERKAAIKEAAK